MTSLDSADVKIGHRIYRLSLQASKGKKFKNIPEIKRTDDPRESEA
ncbi:MAG: hypothetical protein WB392_13165 [Methanotrichaceae archaeon]